MVGSQLVDGDVVYIKDITALHSFSDDQLKHLALFADGAFNSIDLVLFGRIGGARLHHHGYEHGCLILPTYADQVKCNRWRVDP